MKKSTASKALAKKKAMVSAEKKESKLSPAKQKQAEANESKSYQAKEASMGVEKHKMPNGKTMKGKMY